MSTRPNVILMAVLRPDRLSRKARREILEAAGITDLENDIRIDNNKHSYIVWATEACVCYNCSPIIKVTANYWQERNRVNEQDSIFRHRNE